MPNTPQNSELYLTAIEYTLNLSFTAFTTHQDVLSNIRGELDGIGRLKQIHNDVFIDRDQWSPNANYYYTEYMQRLDDLNARSTELGIDQQSQIESALTQMGATEEAMAINAGSILQFAKQVLSYRFGGKSNLPTSRRVGSQPVTELIWEGRNHSMHWEENNPKPPLVAMLNALSADFGLSLPRGKNHAWTILSVIGWKTANDTLTELKNLIQ